MAVVLPADKLWGIGNGRWEDKTGLVAEKEAVADDSLVQIHLEELVARGRLLPLHVCVCVCVCV